MTAESSATRSDGAHVSPDEQRTLRRAVAASAIGNLTEWYDYTSYAYVAVYIGAVFFPSDDPVTQTLASFGVFAISFVIRPFGGIVFGLVGDRLGRQRALALTILLMAGGTFLIGLVPGYAAIGVAAPILLVLLRLLQGFSTGGEWSGAATFIAEYAPDRRRGFFGSWLEVGSLGGYLLAAAVATISTFAVGEAGMQAWGWRIPFLVALPLGAVGLYLRFKLEDTPVFRELEASGQKETSSKRQVAEVARHWRPILTCIGVTVMFNVAGYTLLTYMPTYLQGSLEFTAHTGLLLTMGVYAGMMCVIPFVGRLSDRVGRRPLWMLSGVGLLVLPVPMFALMPLGVGPAVLGFMVLGLLFALQVGQTGATFPAMFATHVRYAAFAVSYNLSVSLFGGTAPLVNEMMIERLGTSYFPAFYMMAASIVGLVALRFMPETANASLRGTEIPRTGRRPVEGADR